MIEYVINNSSGCLIYQNDCLRQLHQSNLSMIKSLCQDALFSYDGYLKAVHKKFGKSYRVPVYINEENMFIPIKRTRDYDNIWVNYAAIIDVNHMDDQIELLFFSQHKLTINISIKSFMRQIKYLEAIRNAKVKHFHS